MFFDYGYEISKILNDAEKERYELAHPYVGSEHLLLSILKNDFDLSEILTDYDLTYSNFKNALISSVGHASKKQEINLYTPLLKRIISNATTTAKEAKRSVNCRDFIISLIEESEGIAFRILLSMDIDLDKIYNELKTNANDLPKLKIDEVAICLNDTINMEERIIGRENILKEIEEILLRKNKNNPLLVGKAGVGKTAIVEELARRINSNNVPISLQNKKIYSLDMASLVAGTKYRGEFEERFTKILKEVIKNDNIILFIDEVHTVLNAGGSEGAINAADILKPYMARGNIKIIGATTKEEYKKYLLKDKALERRFELINIIEPSLEDTIKLITKIKKEYEEYHHVKISNSLIKYLVVKTNKFIENKCNPDKTIDILDSLCTHVVLKQQTNNQKLDYQKLKEESLQKGDYDKASYYYQEELLSKEKLNQNYLKVTKKDIDEVIEKKANIPIISLKKLYEYSNKIFQDSSKIDHLCHIFSSKLNNITEFSSCLITIDKDIDSNKFANELGKIYQNYLYLNLKEFSKDIDQYKIIGSPNNYENYLFKDYNPYTMLIIDNIEYASKDIKLLIDKILSDHKITLSNGEELNFNKSMILILKKFSQNTVVGFNNNLKEDNFKKLFQENIYIQNSDLRLNDFIKTKSD